MNQYVEFFQNLSEEDSDLPIKIMVKGDDVCEDNTYDIKKIASIAVEEYCDSLNDEVCLVGESQILDELGCIYDDDESLIQKEYNNLGESGKIKRAIFVYLN